MNKDILHIILKFILEVNIGICAYLIHSWPGLCLAFFSMWWVNEILSER